MQHRQGARGAWKSRAIWCVLIVVLSGIGGSLSVAQVFTAGYRTAYAASQFDGIDWQGDAQDWFRNASAKGWKTTSDPLGAKPGAIVIWSGGKFGHVAVVRTVSTDGIVIQEMNYGQVVDQDTMKTENFGKVTAANLRFASLDRSKALKFSGYVLHERAGSSGDSVPATGPSAQSQTAPYHGFEAGYCTYYAAREFDKLAGEPKGSGWRWRGDAGLWLKNAGTAGYETTSDPRKGQKGAIAVWSSGGFGHVAIVTGVTASSVYIAEMNWGLNMDRDGRTDNFGRVTTTTLKLSALTRGDKVQYAFHGYILPKTNSNANAAETPNSVQAQPSDRFVYWDGKSVYLWEAGAKRLVSARGYRASMSHNGDLCAFQTSGLREPDRVWVYDLRAKRTLTYLDNAGMASLSPDGKMLAFERFERSATLGSWKAYVAALPSLQNPIRVFAHGSEDVSKDVYGLEWSNDSQRLYASDSSNVFVQAIPGQVQMIGPIDHFTGDKNPIDNSLSLRENPQSSGLFLFDHNAECDPKVVGDDGDSHAIFVYDSNSKIRHRLTPKSLNSVYPCWSEDGRWIYFGGYSVKSPSRPWIYRMNAKGTDLKRICPGLEPCAG